MQWGAGFAGPQGGSLAALTARCLASAFLLVVFLLSSPAIGNSAEYAEGARAFERGDYTRAIELWRRAAWVDDDIDAELELADLYRQGKYAQKDMVESYVWTYLALLNNQRLSDLFNVTDSLAIDVTNRSKFELPYLYVSMNSRERYEAEQRIVYILASRGADGFFRLGEAYFSCWRAPSDQLDKSGRDSLLCRRSMGPQFTHLDGSNVISENPVDAYAYFSIAEELRQKYARTAKDQIKMVLGIDLKAPKTRDSGGRSSATAGCTGSSFPSGTSSKVDKTIGSVYSCFAESIITSADRMAEFWEPPFEVYPKPYSDESRIDSDKEDALAKIVNVPCSSIQEALLAIGFYSGAIDGSCAGTSRKAMLQYQASLGVPTTGELTPQQIVRLVRTSAVNGNAAGQFTLGTMYFYGYGVPISYPRARTWFEKAGDQRHPYALYNLGIMYRDGLGVDVDFGQAATYFMAARRSHYPNDGEISCRLAEVNWPDEGGEHGSGSTSCSGGRK